MATFVRNRSVISVLLKVPSRKYSATLQQTVKNNTTNKNTAKNNVLISKLNHKLSRRWNLIHTTASYRKTVAFKLSDIGEGIREVVVKEWFVKEGDKVEQFDNICEVQSDKAAVTITSRYDGVVTKLYHMVDEMVLVGNPLVDIDVDDGTPAEEDTSGESGDETEKSAEPKSNPPTSVSTPEESFLKVLTTPAVRRIAMQYKLDLQTVKATGKNGRVLKEDVLSHLNLTSDETNYPTQKPADIRPKTTAPPVVIVAEDRVEPISGFSRIMVKTMTESLKIPHFVYSDDVDVSKLVQLRTDLKDTAAERNVKLTYMPFLIKAASFALRKFPVINSSLDASLEKIIYKASHNIGIAMDTPNGLVVPNVKNVQSKSILQIASELNKLQEAGMKGTLTMEALAGATFSLSNIGIIGGTYTKPVIVPPQVSIGALGKIQVLPRFDKDGGLVKAHIMCVSWSADHRIVDGVTMARFSNEWKYYVENPNNFLLEL